ncbi:hypothetical protein HYFRA_00006122 [Hymenoscyphus fraxineus]|uniref:Uncharacterized protein n=1 Tax=Hymenoscyphus fraxineus TaxID=746836 RepID=A0A9N9LBR9_9HELO|nr:hypothetical protein HYFRA_00006122 [Hymenoscyphus fraxineus]
MSNPEDSNKDLPKPPERSQNTYDFGERPDVFLLDKTAKGVDMKYLEYRLTPSYELRGDGSLTMCSGLPPPESGKAYVVLQYYYESDRYGVFVWPEDRPFMIHTVRAGEIYIASKLPGEHPGWKLAVSTTMEGVKREYSCVVS